MPDSGEPNKHVAGTFHHYLSPVKPTNRLDRKTHTIIEKGKCVEDEHVWRSQVHEQIAQISVVPTAVEVLNLSQHMLKPVVCRIPYKPLKKKQRGCNYLHNSQLVHKSQTNTSTL